jgi:hypothetical protein
MTLEKKAGISDSGCPDNHSRNVTKSNELRGLDSAEKSAEL